MLAQPFPSTAADRLARNVLSSGAGRAPAVDVAPPWIEEFVEELSTVRPSPSCTNFYAAGTVDNEVRRGNLKLYLTEMARRRPSVLLVGEAPGYRGTRVTGVPFADHGILVDGIPSIRMFGGDAGYSLPSDARQPLTERTSTVVWRTFAKYGFVPLLWAAFPFHPHGPGDPASNRAPTRRELDVGREFLERILDVWPLQRVLAVGRVAENSLRILGLSCAYIRHPARGGHEQFDLGVGSLASEFPSNHDLPAAESPQLTLGGLRPSLVPDSAGL